MMRLLFAGLHLLALGLGLGAVIQRGVALAATPDAGTLRRAFRADAIWGVAAFLWLATGLARWLASMEKSVEYYNTNHLFMAKLGLFVLVFVLEIWPMIALIRWRKALRSGVPVESFASPSAARGIAIISHVQALLVVAMIFLASAMARGYGTR